MNRVVRPASSWNQESRCACSSWGPLASLSEVRAVNSHPSMGMPGSSPMSVVPSEDSSPGKGLLGMTAARSWGAIALASIDWRSIAASNA